MTQTNDRSFVARTSKMVWRLRIRAAHKLVMWLTKGAMHAAPLHKATVAGAALFWYVSNGQRRFLLIRNKAESSKFRFLSFVDFDPDKTAGEMMRDTVREQLGDVFFKSLPLGALAGDSVAAAPTFHAKDTDHGAVLPLQALVWTNQITKEQAELAMVKADDLEFTIAAEAELQRLLEPAHKFLFQAALRHVHHQAQEVNPATEKLNELLDSALRNQRVLH